MTGLHMTKLAEGEEILFGPARKATTTNLTVKSEDKNGEVTHTSLRTICITNQRVIIEAGDSAINYPNNDVRTILINLRKDKKKKPVSFNILQIRTGRGNTVKIEIPGVNIEKLVLLRQVFPNATVSESRGMGGLLDRIFGG